MRAELQGLKKTGVLVLLAVFICFQQGYAAPAAKEQKSAPAPEKKIIEAKAEYVGMEACEACHEKQVKEFKLSTHARISIPGQEGKSAQGCEMCHGPGSLHVDAGGGRGNHIINPKKDPSACFKCHIDKKLEFRLPYHHPVLEGKMSCSDCHNAHGEEIKPWTATTMNSPNEACFKCHKDKRGPFVFEHEAMREGCVACHKVHGSIHDKMLIARDTNLCLRCHMQRKVGRNIGNEHSDMARGACWSGGCHSAPHGSNFNETLLGY